MVISAQKDFCDKISKDHNHSRAESENAGTTVVGSGEGAAEDSRASDGSSSANPLRRLADRQCTGPGSAGEERQGGGRQAPRPE